MRGQTHRNIGRGELKKQHRESEKNPWIPCADAPPFVPKNQRGAEPGKSCLDWRTECRSVEDIVVKVPRTELHDL